MTKKNKKNNMKISMQRPIIDAEAFLKFFEETTGAKFVDVKVLKKNLIIISQRNNIFTKAIYSHSLENN